MDVITFPENGGLLILLHGVISLPDATSYDKLDLLEAINLFLSGGLSQTYCYNKYEIVLFVF